MEFRSQCPVATALDIFGDRWTLVVLRTIFAGRHRYGDLLKMPEGISTNILADRLALLEREGLVTASPYQANPVRNEYHLTEKGADLLPVLQALSLWALKHVPGRWTPPEWFRTGSAADFYPAPAGRL
jgi:DNA-binding HxlR family transcriptional regulator